jgi:eukaryotic-like serine/threonine-protein kinase
MALTPGTRLGPYELVSAIGAGGMGEVYRARDTRLGRDVAVKVLPESFSGDLDRRARFEREAQAVAALSHPNIVAIHDSGAHDGHVFVVMELLAGESLRQRLSRGALPVRKAVEIAIQIARGLGAAHGKGLVHRDLKPDNVFLLDDGQVKILDFGLARQTAPADHSGATQTQAATDPGIVMGTIGYMAPEQVRGQAVDARADVFAFGAVLYEMVSGARAFQRETTADTMTAILTQDPPELVGSRPDLSPALDRIIRHCLEKNPNERFQSARDIAFALEALSGSTASAPAMSGAAPAIAPAPPARRGISVVLVAALMVAAAAAGAVAAGLWPRSTADVQRFTMKTFDPQAIFNARFMADGETIIFSAAPVGNVPSLFEIRPGTLEARAFGPPGTHLLSVSAKGELAVLTGAAYLNHRLFAGKLAVMTVEGAPRVLADDVRDADWDASGANLAVIRRLASTDRLEYPVGKALHEANGYLSDVRVSPDGTRVAFMAHPSRYDDRGYIKVVDASGHVTTLAGEYWGEEGIAWTQDGAHIMFAASARAGNSNKTAGEMSYQIYEVAADGRTPATLAFPSPADFTILDLGRDGRWLATRDDLRYGIVARGAGQAQERDLGWLNKNWGPSLSSDGHRLLFADGNASADYAVSWRNVDGSPVVRLGDGDAYGWSGDGKWAAGLIQSSSKIVLYPADAGSPVPLDTAPVTHVEGITWYPDSKSVVYSGAEPSKPARLYRQALAGGRPEPFLADDLASPTFSPDGTLVVCYPSKGLPALYPVNGGPSRPIPGIRDTDDVVGFTEDGRALIVHRDVLVPAGLDRIDLSSGARTSFKELAPADRAGLVRIAVSGPVLKADGSQYAYSYLKRLSTLFVREGK